MNIQTFLEKACKFVHKINDSLIRQPNDKESYFYSERYVYCKVINQCQKIFGFLILAQSFAPNWNIQYLDHLTKSLCEETN